MSEEKDLVERLEWLAYDDESDIGLAPGYMLEAASEITRLRGEVSEMQAFIDSVTATAIQKADAAEAEVKRLRKK